MSQALQEYAAVVQYYKTNHDRFANQPGERMQMLARLGFAKDDVGPALAAGDENEGNLIVEVTDDPPAFRLFNEIGFPSLSSRSSIAR